MTYNVRVWEASSEVAHIMRFVLVTFFHVLASKSFLLNFGQLAVLVHTFGHPLSLV